MSEKLEPLLIQGMFGMGDGIHQRAVVKHFMQRYEVYLETPWPWIYKDLVGPRLKLVSKLTTLRTQAANARREAGAYHSRGLPPFRKRMKVWYPPESVRKHGSVLGAMMAEAGISGEPMDFSMPVDPEWAAQADSLIRAWHPEKPMLIYRPLVERKEWGGCAARNPDHAAYYDLIMGIRDRFFVVSVADLVAGVEGMVSRDIDPDVRIHHGEIKAHVLAALVARAAVTFASPGFLTIMAQAVGTPSITVFGGYEDGRSFSAGAALAPHLPIDTIKPCQCFRHDHACVKRIDLPLARRKIEAFLDAHPLRSVSEVPPEVRLARPADPIHEPG